MLYSVAVFNTRDSCLYSLMYELKLVIYMKMKFASVHLKNISKYVTTELEIRFMSEGVTEE